jgi:tetratricopeptide (TPR) repeat protein
MSSNRLYNTLLKEAETAESEGKWREAANKHLQAVAKAPSVWTPHRWQAFLNYSNMWQQHSLEMTTAEWKNLKKIAKKQEEPVLFRCEALYLRGFIQLKAGEMEDAAMYFRRALHTMKEVTPLENMKKINLTMGGTQVLLSARDQLFATLKPMIDEHLDFLEQPQHVDAAVLQSVPRVGGQPDPSIVKRLTVGGSECDACHKSRTDVEEILQRCSRCKRAYYCSTACQQRQWNAGHHAACCKPGEIQADDYMVLKGLQRRPELNGKVVQIQHPAKDGRWAVSTRGQSKTLSIAPRNLVHIRPAM